MPLKWFYDLTGQTLDEIATPDARNQKIAQLDIAVDNACAMGMSQCIERLTDESDPADDGQRSARSFQ